MGEDMSLEKNEILLEINSLAKNYGAVSALKDISFNIHKGEVVVILGPSGCGKSTFLRCLNGLESLDGGTIHLSGIKIGNNFNDWPSIRQRIGMVFQSYDLFPNMTILDNVTLGPIKVQKRDKKEVCLQAEALLERVGLIDKINSYPHTLSGGQKQRVAIVRALCMNPEIMLFDEVTASLDPEMVREVLDVILELAKQGMTMLIVTHELAFAKAVADTVVFIDGGVIEEITETGRFFEEPETERAKRFLNTFKFD